MSKRAIIVGTAMHAAIAKTLAEDGVATIAELPDGDLRKHAILDPALVNADLEKGEIVVLAQMAAEFPDRISIERRSPFYDSVVENLGVRIDGIEQDSVVEYCVSEGWARIGERDHRGKLVWEYDHYRSRRVEGVQIEPYWRKPLSRQQRRSLAARQRKGRKL